MARKGIQLRIFSEILYGLGEIDLEKNSLNFYKCRGMSRFGEKKSDANNKASRFARRLKNRKTRSRITVISNFCVDNSSIIQRAYPKINTLSFSKGDFESLSKIIEEGGEIKQCSDPHPK